MRNRFIPDLSSVLDTDHTLPVGCKGEKKKSSYPQVSVRLPPTSQPLVKTKITNNNYNNNNKNQEIGKKVKKGNKTRNRKTESESVVRLGELTAV